jgi:hypothetical protein
MAKRSIVGDATGDGSEGVAGVESGRVSWAEPTTGTRVVPGSPLSRVESMPKSVEGVYRDGKVELLEPPPKGAEGRVIVTFLADSDSVNLAERGIDRDHAADLRRRLASFAEDWQRPEMDVYDDL